jgi:hypothetical protein
MLTPCPYFFLHRLPAALRSAAREGTLIRHTGGPPPPTGPMLPLDPPHGRAIAASNPRHTDSPYSSNLSLVVDVICPYFDFDSHA